MSNTCKTLCEICVNERAIYKCPKCGIKYCSVECYKSHELCSESFYKEWIEIYMKDKTFDDKQRQKTIDILKKFKNEEAYDETPDRFFGQDLDANEEDIYWQCLSEAERAEFNILLTDDKSLIELIPIVEPWWTCTNVVRIVDLEILNENVKESRCPPHPMDVKKLSDILSKKPSNCLKLNFVNILYTYCFLYRFYNCQLRDLIEDVVKNLLDFSPVLTGERNYSSLEETLQDSMRLITTSDLNVSLHFVKSISRDVCLILGGPENAPSTYFVMCALNDMKLLILELKQELSIRKNAELKKKIMPVVKKIDFFMSWCSDFSHVFSELASEIALMMVPDFITDIPDIKPSETNKTIHKVAVIED